MATATTGVAATGVPTTATQADAADDVQSATPNQQTADYTNIFNSEMASQTALFAQITALNDQKNKVSSFLTLAKSVSEKVN